MVVVCIHLLWNNDYFSQGGVDCPCLWAEVSEVLEGNARLFVAYDIGAGVQISQVPIRSIRVEPIFETRGPVLMGSAGVITKRIYIILFRLVHILFPTMESWKLSLMHSDEITFDRNVAMTTSKVLVDICSRDGSLIFSQFVSYKEMNMTYIKPNFLLSCLEACEVDDPREDPSKDVENKILTVCLRSVRQLRDVLAKVRGIGQLSTTPLPSPRHHIFQSPAKKPIVTDSCLDIKTAVSMVEMGTASDFRDGSLYLQSICKSPSVTDIAVRKGVFRALVSASVSLLSSPIMGTVEQLSILTLTTSQVLDHCTHVLSSSKILVTEIIESLKRPIANYKLSLQFITAMIHRSDVKDAAIELQLYNALSGMYINRLPLLEPLADALTACDDDGASNDIDDHTDIDDDSSNIHSTPASFSSRAKRGNVPLLGLESLPSVDGHLALSPTNSGLTRATRRNQVSARISDIDSAGSDGESRLSATHEMDHLAQALGESLVAQDLPCLIGLRRRMGQLSSTVPNNPTSRDDKSFLHQVGSTSDLRAHKVFPANSSDDDMGSDISTFGVARISECHPSTSRNELESFSSKHETLLETVEDSIDLCPYLVNAMLAAHSPFPGCYRWDPDPSSLITADILSFPAHLFEGNAYILTCLKLLARISSTKEHSGHIFLVGIGNKLKSLVSSRSFGTEMGTSLAAYYLSITYEYVSLCSGSRMSSVFAETALCPILQILSNLQTEGPISEWSSISLILFSISIKILENAIRACDADKVGQEYIRRLFGEVDNTAFSLMKDVSRQTLLAVTEYPSNSTEIGDIEKNILFLFSSMINLVNGIKSMDGKTGSVLANCDVLCQLYKTQDSEVLTRSACLQQFSFLITPGSSLIRYTLEGEIWNREMEYLQGKSGKCTLSSRFIRLRNGVFSLLQGLFSAAQNSYVSDKEMMDYYVRLHFIRLLKLYHNPDRDHQALFLCRQHLLMLCNLAQAARKSQISHASKRFQHLSVVGFFVKEMSLEYEALESDVGGSYLNTDERIDSIRMHDERGPSKSSRSIQSSTDGSMYEEVVETFKAGDLSKREPAVPRLSLNFSSDKLKSAGQNIEYSPGPSTSKSGNTILAANDNNVYSNEQTLGERILERQGTSAALSLDTPLLRSVGHGGFLSPKESSSINDLPAGFAFTGDLDEDVDRLEALGIEDTSDSDSMSFPCSDDESVESLVTGGSSAPSIQEKKQTVPRLSISSSMRSSLHKRNQSAELFKESEGADPGRSILGNIERQALGNGKMQAVRFVVDGSESISSSSRRTFAVKSNALETEQNSRLLYQDEEMHILAIRLIFMLIIDDEGQLHSSYCDRLPWEKKMQNIPFILQQHLNAQPTVDLLPRIESDLYENVGESAVLFLRVLSSELFRPSWYLSRARISGATGAYATVYRCSLPWWSPKQGTVLKVIDAPKYNHDRCSQIEFYSEIYIHQKLLNHPRVCKMLDFGFDTRADALVLVLEEYKCSLKQWRLAQEEPAYRKSAIYWAIFREIVVACIEILDAGVVHFDLKCDNVLLNPLPGVSEEAFWKGAKSGSKLLSFLKKSGNNPHLAFKVVLGDFGESLLFPGGKHAAESGSTSMARGTDAFKSPEMLMIGGASQVNNVGYDRRRHHGAGAASDVWSLGCLLFELFTGNMLFSDNDWLQLAARVTTPGSQLITPEKQKLIAGLPGVEEMLYFMLIRDPTMRPTLRDVLHRLDSMVLDHSCGSPHESSPSSSRSSPGTAREIQMATDYEKCVSLSDSKAPTRITCMHHVSDYLSVCPLSDYNQPSRVSRSTKRKQLIILSSKLMFTESSCHRETVTAYSKSAVLQSVDLENCMWKAIACSDHPCIYRCPSMPDASVKTISTWINFILEMTNDIINGGIPDILIISDDMDQLAAFVAVAIMARQSGSTYQAMVHGAHCGLDRHLDAPMVDILCQL